MEPQNVYAGGQVTSVAIDPLHVGRVYAGVTGAGVWRSEDCGATWTHTTTGTNAQLLESGDQWQMTVDANTSALYADSGYGGNGLYRSTNNGVDWDDLTPQTPGIPRFIQGFSFDPGNPSHVLVGFHDNCSGEYAPMCLGESNDGGASWRFVKGPIDGWEEGGGPVLIGGSQWIYAGGSGLFYSGDSGANWKKEIGYPGCGGGYVKIAGSYYFGCGQNIQMSSDLQNWKALDNSPRAGGMTTTGQYVYAAFQNDNSGQPVHRAPIDDLTQWTHVATPPISEGGGMAYDANHHILYFAAWGGGMWRVQTQ